MQTKHLCVLINIWINGEVGAPLSRFKPSSKIFYWLFQDCTSFVDLLCFSVLSLLFLCTHLFICTFWSPAGKGLTTLLLFVVSNCEFLTFPLVSWVRCGTWLYRFLILAPLLTFGWSFIRPPVRHNFVSAQYLQKKNEISSPNCVYALISTISWFVLLHINFHSFGVDLWPLNDVRILFRISSLLTILRTKIDFH